MHWLGLSVACSTACVLTEVNLDHRECPCVQGWVCRDGECVADATEIDGGAPGDAGGDGAGGDVVAIRCPATTEGPTMVPAGSYCIDATEVSVAHYRRFVEAGVPPQTDARCASNTSYGLATRCCSPDAGEPPPDVPAMVGYCDAVAFCAWAGKRLCGAIDGGSLAVDGGGERSSNQWLQACTGAEGRVYPYGNDLDVDACAAISVYPRVGYGEYDGIPAIGTHPRCEGAYPGLFDMVGNGPEWIDECDEHGCVAYGVGNCRTFSAALIDVAYSFRCCAP